MKTLTSDDAQLVYEVTGSGAPVVLLHPFPVHHGFWAATTTALSSRYQLIIPDIRGHGDSGVGQGPATMTKHAEDLNSICDQEGIARAAFVGVSIGGYILFEFWRRHRERVQTLVLCNTRASAETPESRATRLRSAAEVLERGTEQFAESMLAKLLGKSTLDTRADLADEVRQMILKMSPEDVDLVQKGMADRPDSVPTLKTIVVPTLVIAGEEDAAIPVGEAEVLRQNISGAQMRVIPKAGHYAAFEQPGAVGLLLRQFLDSAHRP
jgi:pimeloyl-ACP methyl ester carboxylesterase